VTTGTDGVATFQWKPDNSSATSTVTLAETVNPGYEFVDANCSTVTAGRRGRTRLIRPVRSTIPSAQVTVGPNQYVKCTVRNRRPATPPTTGAIVIRKNATPQSAQEFPFTGSLGPFTLVDNDTGASASRAFTNLAPGTYTVAEMVPADWTLTGLGCVPTAAAQIAAPQATITLVAGQTVYCQFDDTRNDTPPEPPDPPEPPLPQPPGPTPPPEPGQPVEPPPSTQLEIEKTLQRVARVGGRIRFSIKVTNTGSVPATNVQLGDVPPSALAISGLKSTSKPKIVRGNAIWSLGTLAPGQSRTISGSVRVDAAAPGLARNLALAAADNADLVSDPANTRVLGRQQVLGAPPVTG
jgi:uncharacterized repeat protein (TIGR01451 family)